MPSQLDEQKHCLENQTKRVLKRSTTLVSSPVPMTYTVNLLITVAILLDISFVSFSTSRTHDLNLDPPFLKQQQTENAKNKSVTTFIADFCYECDSLSDILIATVAYGDIGGDVNDGYVNVNWEFDQWVLIVDKQREHIMLKKDKR